jgi:hypothetical protein
MRVRYAAIQRAATISSRAGRIRISPSLSFAGDADARSLDEVRKLLEAGRFAVFGEASW